MPEFIRFKYLYDFAKTFHRLGELEKQFFHPNQQTFIRPWVGRKGPLLLKISYDQSKEGVWLDIEGDLEENEWQDIQKQVRKVFSLDVDLEPFYKQAIQDEVLYSIILKKKGMHLILDPSLYECLMKTIISQQVHTKFAATLIQRFIQLAGEEFEALGKKWIAFPTPERVASLKPENLRKLQFNQRKAETIIELSQLISEGKLELEQFSYLSDEEVMEKLLPIRGIGPWTVECVLLFGLGRPNRLPASDIGLRNAIQHFYGLSEQPDEKMVQKLGEKWSPYRSYATFYLWDALNDIKNKNAVT